MDKKNKQTKQERLDKMHNKEKVKKEVITILIVLLILVGFYFLISDSKSKNLFYPKINSSQVPKGPIHWHANLSIIINGVEQIIPANIGLTSSGEKPTHTHDTSGKIHLENSNPQLTPETFSLGYFFYTWGKRFNSTCILDKCTNIDGGSLKFYVNGKQNFKYEKYIMQDDAKMLIEYNSK